MVLSQCMAGTGRRKGSFLASKKIDYSLFFLMTLCREKAPCSTRRIAKEGGISFSFLQKIAHLLKRAGIVTAARGKDGGYVLARKARTITMKDIMEAVDGAVTPFACAEPKRAQQSCPRRNFCEARSAHVRAQTQVMEHYFSKTLSDMVSKKS